MADNYLSFIAYWHLRGLECWGVRARGRPPELILFSVNPDIARGLGNDAHKIEPTRGDGPCGRGAGSRFSAHLKLNKALAVACFPQSMSGYFIHCCNRAARKACEPFVIFDAEIGDKHFHCL